jgi:hypothetical protein
MAGEYGVHQPSRNGGKVAFWLTTLVLGGVCYAGGKEFYDMWQETRCEARNPPQTFTVPAADVALLREDALRMFAGSPTLYTKLSKTALQPVIDATVAGEGRKEVLVEVSRVGNAPVDSAAVTDAALVSTIIDTYSRDKNIVVRTAGSTPAEVAYPDEAMWVTVTTDCERA